MLNDDNFLTLLLREPGNDLFWPAIYVKFEKRLKYFKQKVDDELQSFVTVVKTFENILNKKGNGGELFPFERVCDHIDKIER